MNDEWKTLGWLFGAGLVAGLGGLLDSKETLDWRIIVGRALTSGMLGVAAGATLAAVPGLGLTALVGLSAVFASIGTSGLERLLQHRFGGTKK